MRARILSLVLAGLATPAVVACGDPAPAGSDDPLPTSEERLAEWETQPEGTAVPVALGFGGPVADSALAALLTRNTVRPYAVYLVAGGMGASFRRERIRASLELLGEAREQAVAQLRTSLCAQPGRARAMLEAGSPPADPAGRGRERQLLGHLAELQRSIPAIERGAPVIYGVEVLGTAEDVRALREEPLVRFWEPGWRGGIEGVDTVVVPAPPAPPELGPVTDSGVLALAPEQVHERLVALTTEGVGSCEDATPSDEPR